MGIKRKMEAYCKKCGKTIAIDMIPLGLTPTLQAQFLRCPDCHKGQDFAYFQIGVRECFDDRECGYVSIKKETYGQWIKT